MRGNYDEYMALVSPACLAGDYFKYYGVEFTKDNAITDNRRSFIFFKIR